MIGLFLYSLILLFLLFGLDFSTPFSHWPQPPPQDTLSHLSSAHAAVSFAAKLSNIAYQLVFASQNLLVLI